MIILDTNVISELMRPQPDPSVERWASRQHPTRLFTTAVSAAELRYGVAILAPGRRRALLMEQIEALFREEFGGRILPFDAAATVEFASIAAMRRGLGRPIAQADAQIAAIAKSRGAQIATRNISDFTDCGISLLNPWLGEALV